MPKRCGSTGKSLAAIVLLCLIPLHVECVVEEEYLDFVDSHITLQRLMIKVLVPGRLSSIEDVVAVSGVWEPWVEEHRIGGLALGLVEEIVSLDVYLDSCGVDGAVMFDDQDESWMSSIKIVIVDTSADRLIGVREVTLKQERAEMGFKAFVSSFFYMDKFDFFEHTSKGDVDIEMLKREPLI